MKEPEFERQRGPEIDRQMSARIRTAVQSVAAPPFLESRIRNNIRAVRPPSVWRTRLVAAAATLIICIGATVAYQWQNSRLTHDSYIASVSSQVAGIMRIGLGDHIHCAVFRTYPKTPPQLEDLAKTMGAKYEGLTKIVSAHVPAGYQLMMAHRCSYHGRQFVHLALTGGGQILSVVIAAKGEGETFAAGGLVPALSAAGIPVYRDTARQFQVAAFESSKSLIYVISDMPQQKNTDMLLALAPAVQQFLKTLES